MATLCMILNRDAAFRSYKINSVTKGIVNSVQVRIEPVEIKGGNNFCHKLYCSLGYIYEKLLVLFPLQRTKIFF